MDQVKRNAWDNLKWLAPGILALLSIAFALLFSRNFHWPIGVGYDSVIYINAAKSLAAGNGFTQASIQITHFPPLYPGSLALVSWITGRDIVSSATILVIFLYGLNIFLAGMLVWRVTKSKLAGIAISILTAILPGFVSMHFEAMSEPLFFALFLSALIFLFEYVQSGKLTWAILAGVFAGLSAFTRYIGIFVIATVALSVLFLHPGTLFKRLFHSIISGLAGILPLIGWLLKNQLSTGGLTNRTFVFHPKDFAYYLSAGAGIIDLSGIRIIKEGLPGISTIIIIISACFALTLCVYFSIKKIKQLKCNSGYMNFLIICLVSMVTYLIFLLFSINFFDASTRLTDRILSPLYLLFILGIFVLCWPISQQLSMNKDRALLFLLIIFLVFANLPGFVTETASFRQKGDKFTGKEWSRSETISWLNQLPDSIIIYSNENVPIGFLTRHSSYSLPEKTNSLTGLPSSTFKEETLTMKNDLLQGRAVFVKTTTKAYSELFQPKNVITIDLVKCKTLEDSFIFTAPDHFQELCDR